MFVGVYGLPQVYDAVRAVRDGFEKLGARAVHRNPNAWSGRDCDEPFSVVVVASLRGPAKSVRDHFEAKGTPVLVLDLGFMRRAFSGKPNTKVTHQLGINRLNWVPPAPLPPDRLDRLGIAVAPQGTRSDRAPILVVGQKIGDAAHGMGEQEILAWADRTIATLRRYTRRPILWRPHPKSPHMVAPSDGLSVGPISDALAQVALVATYNSNTGHDALLAGVPVICDASCHYLEVASCDLKDARQPKVASVEARRSYFSRLAYAQWTTLELESGEALRFILPHAGIDAEAMPTKRAVTSQWASVGARLR